jgi:hypothetical protein
MSALLVSLISHIFSLFVTLVSTRARPGCYTCVTRGSPERDAWVTRQLPTGAASLRGVGLPVLRRLRPRRLESESVTLLSHTSVTHFCHTLLSHTSVTLLSHFCHTLLSHTSVTHFCHTLLSHTSVTHFCHTLLSHTSVTHFCRTFLTYDAHLCYKLWSHCKTIYGQR